MRRLPFISMFIGIVSFLGALSCIGTWEGAANIISGFILGVCLICLSVAVRQKRPVALQIGYAVLASGAVSFVSCAFPHAASLPAWQRNLVLISCTVGGLVVALYWANFWKRHWQNFIGVQDGGLAGAADGGKPPV